MIAFLMNPLLLSTLLLLDNDFSKISTNIVAHYWITDAEQSQRLTMQSSAIYIGTVNNKYPVIDIDTSKKYQRIDGFGYTLTGASAFLINKMHKAAKINLLKELFGKYDNAIGISYLRISVGASDLNNHIYSYNDLPTGKTDTTLNQFSLSDDKVDLIPLLKLILAINPSIKILASPWSAPAWMKNNQKTKGGSLLPQYYSVYATYLAKYIQQMKMNGISIDALTIQNEPENGGNNPSMVMTAEEQTNLVKNYLGPLFKQTKIKTKIIIWDHNCDNPNYPISILNDSLAKQYIAGSAFHLYAGEINALSKVFEAHPDKDLYFTEQWTGKNGRFSEELQWHTKNVIIGSMRNYSKVALEWNLANDPDLGPHTLGGCTECKGALTIEGSNVTRNVSYYIIAHASKFVPAGSVRIASNIETGLFNVAFLTPEGRKVIIVLNDSSSKIEFNIRQNNQYLTTQLKVGSVATFIL